jgi:hypothetical protein
VCGRFVDGDGVDPLVLATVDDTVGRLLGRPSRRSGGRLPKSLMSMRLVYVSSKARSVWRTWAGTSGCWGVAFMVFLSG